MYRIKVCDEDRNTILVTHDLFVATKLDALGGQSWLLVAKAWMFDHAWCKGTPWIVEKSVDGAWRRIYEENMP